MSEEQKVITLSKLTLKQERFVKEFLATRKVAQSYRTAYNTENMTADSIKVAASQELAKPHIQAAVVAHMMANPTDEPDELNPDYIKRQLKLEIENSETDGARVNALGISSKIFGMQTTKFESIESEQSDEQLLLGLIGIDYALPPQNASELSDKDTEIYNYLLNKLKP